MGVRRFRSVAEMDAPHWYQPGDPALYRAIRRVSELGRRTLRPSFPAGVHKHPTLESLNALEETWAQANFDRYRERLARRG